MRDFDIRGLFGTKEDLFFCFFDFFQKHHPKGPKKELLMLLRRILGDLCSREQHQRIIFFYFLSRSDGVSRKIARDSVDRSGYGEHSVDRERDSSTLF
jgi:hypothetical protein